MAVSGVSRTRARLVRAELSFAGGSAREKNLSFRSLVLGGALLFVCNFGLRLGVKNWALGFPALRVAGKGSFFLVEHPAPHPGILAETFVICDKSCSKVRFPPKSARQPRDYSSEFFL